MSICRTGMKILVPIDGSDHSVRALETAVQMAEKFGGKITLLHVVSPQWGPYIDESSLAAAGKAIYKAGERLLAETEKKITGKGIKIEKMIRTGHVVGEITKVSKEEKFDLIVIGARGVSVVTEMLLGSVSHGVIKYSNVPVLVVR